MSKQNTNTRHRRKNSNILQSLTYQGIYDIATLKEIISYNTTSFSKKNLSSDINMRDEVKDDMVTWFKITGLTDVEYISSLCKSFGIHRFDIKDLFSNLQVTKIVTYSEATFVMVSCSFHSEGVLNIEQIAFILGENYIISLQDGNSPIFDDVVTAIQDSRLQLREKGADYLLYILLNAVHNSYIDVISKMNEKLDEVEDALIEQQLTDRSIMRLFRNKRRDYAMIRRAILPVREEIDNIFHNSNGLIQADNMVYFNDFDDRLRTTLEELDMLNVTIQSLMDLYFNNNNLKMNDIIKRLTIVSTIFIPLTFMVGVWGMNFKFMPELEWEHGYTFAWIIMFIIALIAILFLKKKKWF